MQFGPEIQMRVRHQIYDRHAGELLVGVADIVETGHPTDSVSDRGPDDAGADGASRLNQCLPCSPRCVPPCPARHLHKRTTRWSANCGPCPDHRIAGAWHRRRPGLASTHAPARSARRSTTSSWKSMRCRIPGPRPASGTSCSIRIAPLGCSTEPQSDQLGFSPAYPAAHRPRLLAGVFPQKMSAPRVRRRRSSLAAQALRAQC